MDDGKVARIVLLDLSSEFDTINHHKMQSLFILILVLVFKHAILSTHLSYLGGLG